MENNQKIVLRMCFWCRKITGQIVEKGEAEAMVDKSFLIHSYEPCSSCKAQMEKGITFLGTTQKQPKDGRPAIMVESDEYGEEYNVYPTGTWVVIREAAVERIVTDDDEIEKLKRVRKVFCSEQFAQNIISQCCV